MNTSAEHTARRLAVLSALAVVLLSMAGSLSADEAVEPSPNAAGTCQLNTQGGPVDLLTLIDDRGNHRPLRNPGSSVSLPAGRYRVVEVHLQNGYESYIYEVNDDSWFTLAPDRPHDLRLGPPFEAKVEATRQGRLIVLSYELKGADGFDYYPADRSTKPKFTVYKGDRMLGSDDFQYG